MSTRSSIAIVNSDGSVDSVYCHFDGYPSYVGYMLTNFHNSTEDAKQIIELGDLSVLDKLLVPDASKEHSFDSPQLDVSIFYGRDRGDNNVEAKHWDCFDDWFEKLKDTYWAEFGYWWDGSKWHCRSTYAQNEEPLY